MNWYYSEKGKQAGPVDEAELARMLANGKLLDETLVWTEGMVDWRPFRDERHRLKLPELSSLPPLPPAPPLSPTEAICAECGKMFAKEEMIRHGELWVCANCKPVFVQKIAEGARLNPLNPRYAGFWIRFVAKFVDGIVLWPVGYIIRLAAGFGPALIPTTPPSYYSSPGLMFLASTVPMAVAICYETFMIGKYGATLGKMACGIRVVTGEGEKVSYLRALGRYFSTLLSSVICLMGYIMVAFDSQKRALHDYVCNTRVVYKE
jgi:uncharacterized RDD family membrane protein YckC